MARKILKRKSLEENTWDGRKSSALELERVSLKSQPHGLFSELQSISTSLHGRRWG